MEVKSGIGRPIRKACERACRCIESKYEEAHLKRFRCSYKGHGEGMYIDQLRERREQTKARVCC
jgi:hypothetical protein